MTDYSYRMKYLKDNDKVSFYDYITYKREAGWWCGKYQDDWHRPKEIKKTLYNAFLTRLPDYYFLGFPIKELLKSSYSNGYCYTCSLALSLYFDDFEIILANLKNYANHCKKVFQFNYQEYPHAFLKAKINNHEYIIDTTWGMITDYDSYDYLFSLEDIKKITSKDLDNTKVYQYLKKMKKIKSPSYKDREKEEYIDYLNDLNKYVKYCYEYKSDNLVLEDFIRSCLIADRIESTILYWQEKYYYKKDLCDRVNFPKENMLSTIDDRNDFLLDSNNIKTKEENNEVLELYEFLDIKKNKELTIFQKLQRLLKM